MLQLAASLVLALLSAVDHNGLAPQDAWTAPDLALLSGSRATSGGQGCKQLAG